MDRLAQQLTFLKEIDQLKTVFRQSHLIADPTRFENTAEHSWHIALYATVLAEYADHPINLSRVIQMLLLHDLVEIDAGDTFCYDDAGNTDKADREQRAADRIFGLLPADQRDALRALWEEFEAGDTSDAKFAVTIDRIQPLFHNVANKGGSWTRYGIKRAQVEARLAPVAEASTPLYQAIQQLLDEAVADELLMV